MAFEGTWIPGPGAVAGVRNLGRHVNQAALVMTLGSESLVIVAPRGSAEWPEFVRFLRQLRDGAEEMIDFFDTKAMFAERDD
ncbi:hypothetical protein [Amycolatopsis minnesotensis]|uniref:Uncharacterized protein n=1 Tax=Amycolatopsis minnesotensis TaxID=337894 RepID=A0ABN2R4D6_9PSEU